MVRLSADHAVNVSRRPTLEKTAHDGSIGGGRFKRLYSMFYAHGPGNGKFLGLPFDHRVEHGPGHMAKWERSAEPDIVIQLANQGNYSALALPLRTAEKYQNLINPEVPLIVKVDGHFRVGSKQEVPYHRHASYGDTEKMINKASNLGADAVGMTFYIGGEETEEDVERIGEIVEEAHGCGLPAVMWGYARGPLPERVGADSLCWCHAAVAAAEDLGADVVKTKFPRPARNLEEYKKMLLGEKSEKGFVEEKMPEAPEMYLSLEPKKGEPVPYDLHVKRVNLVTSPAKRTLVVVSGGPKLGKDPENELRDTTRIVMDAGAEGRIIGRNFWGRPIKEALTFTRIVTDVMKETKYDRKLREPRFTRNYKQEN